MDKEKKDRTPRQLGKAAVESRGREDPTHHIPKYTGKGRQWEEGWFLRDPQVGVGYPVTGLKSRVVEGGGGGGGGKVQLRQDKPQLPKGEPQAQAPGTRQAPTRPRRRRGRALSDGAASHARLQTSGTHTAKRSKVNCKIPQQCFTQTPSG